MGLHNRDQLSICNKDHNEVCFAGNVCPACAVRESYEEAIDAMVDEFDKMTEVKQGKDETDG